MPTVNILLAWTFFFVLAKLPSLPVLFHVPSIRTHSRTQETAHCETMPPFSRRSIVSNVMPGLLHLCK